MLARGPQKGRHAHKQNPIGWVAASTNGLRPSPKSRRRVHTITQKVQGGSRAGCAAAMAEALSPAHHQAATDTSGCLAAASRQSITQQEQSEKKREGPEDQQALLILGERIGAQTVSLHPKGCSLAKFGEAAHCFPSRTAAMQAGAPARGIALRRRAPSTCPPCPTLPQPECAPGSQQSPPPAAAWTQTASSRRRTWGTASRPAGSAVDR